MAAVKRTRARPRPALIEQQSTMRVSSTAFGDDEERTEVDVHQFVTEPAYVRINAGVTKNLGNYESFRVDVSLTVPCYTEEVDKMAAKVSERVAELLDSELVNWKLV